MRAERRTKKSGCGVEFADHRDYAPGDDFRYLDWNVYQRFDRLLVRLFEEEEDLSIYFIVDASSSMALRRRDASSATRKRARAPRSPTSGLANLDRVTIVAATDEIERAHAADARQGAHLQGLPVPAGARAGGHDRSRRRHEDLRRAAQAPRPRRARSPISTTRTASSAGINVLRYNKFEPFVLHVVDESEARPKLTRRRARSTTARPAKSARSPSPPKVLAQLRAAYEAYLDRDPAVLHRAAGPLRAAPTSNVPFDELDPARVPPRRVPQLRSARALHGLPASTLHRRSPRSAPRRSWASTS